MWNVFLPPLSMNKYQILLLYTIQDSVFTHRENKCYLKSLMSYLRKSFFLDPILNKCNLIYLDSYSRLQFEIILSRIINHNCFRIKNEFNLLNHKFVHSIKPWYWIGSFKVSILHQMHFCLSSVKLYRAWKEIHYCQHMMLLNKLDIENFESH